MEETTTNIINDIASSQVIMTEIIIYCIPSILILLLMDHYAAKKIGSKAAIGYRVLRLPKFISLAIICGFTFIIGLLCMYMDLSVSRGTLTYFGLPYFIALVYYLVKMLRRVQAETRGRWTGTDRLGPKK